MEMGYINETFIFHIVVAGTVITCSSRWTNMRNSISSVSASDRSSNLMDTENLTWTHSDIGNGGQNNLGDMDHKITLNLQFCQEYVFVADRER